jgi:mannose-6-phosphate isomerase-like protein (cupin superfamily)
MRIEHADPEREKGWYAGPWNSDLPISVGYANQGIDEPHLHAQISEIYLVARGSAQIRVNHKTVLLTVGDMILVEPGEAHTFLSSSPNYLHFVIHSPGLTGAHARADKSTVARSRLGL